MRLYFSQSTIKKNRSVVKEQDAQILSEAGDDKGDGCGQDVK